MSQNQEVARLTNLITGQITFKPDVSFDDIVDLAGRMEIKAKERKYELRLVIRRCGKRQFGIAFILEFDGGTHIAKKLMYALTDQLLREFGRGVSWDITDENWKLTE